MKTSILATTLLIGLGSFGTGQSVQAAPINLTTLTFATQTAAPAQAASSNLLIRVVDDRDNLASDGNRDFRSFSQRRRLDRERQARRLAREQSGASGLTRNQFTQGARSPQGGFSLSRLFGWR